jgi:4-amino-4-deoxy-L-arabinose transferase-like glycosyltransferase
VVLPLTALKQHRAFFMVFAFAAALFLNAIWVYKEFVRAESYFALGSRLMIEQGEWLAPHAPDELPLNKPPLTYWLIGVSYRFFGASYGSARLPSGLAALSVLAMIYALGVWLHGKRVGLISAAMLASSYLFLSFTRMAMSDMLLTLCVTGALASFLVTLTSTRSSGLSKFAYVGYAALALGVLTKGPVALALIAMPIVLELMISRNRTGLKQLKIVSGLLLFLLITAPYFLLVYARFGAGPLRFFFFGENLQRFTGQIYGVSGRPFWYELAAFFSDFAPWSLLIFIAAWFDWRAPGHDETRRRAVRVLYLWLACAVVLFSISSFKLDYYLLPAMPAAALIIGNVIANSEKLTLFARRMVELFLVLCSFVILVVALLSLRAADVLSVPTSLRFLPAVVAVAGLAAILVHVFRRKTWQASIILAATLGATILSMECAFLPAFARYLPSTQLAAGVPADRVWYTSWAASEWANSLAFNLAPPHRVERLIGDINNQRLQDVLKNDPVAVAVIWEREYAGLAENDPGLSIIAQAETFGHGGLSLNMIRHPKRERLLVVRHDR